MSFVPSSFPIALFSSTLAASLVEAFQRKRDQELYKPKGRFVHLADPKSPSRRIHVVHRPSSGSRPTVLLEAGANSWSIHWRHLMKLLDLYDYGFIAYDRAGYGFSDPTTAQRPQSTSTFEGSQVVNTDEPDIIQTLRQLEVRGPLVLVAHSMGALLMERYLAHIHHLLQGVVFVDAATPHGVRILSPTLPKAVPHPWIAAILGRIGLLRLIAPRVLNAYWREFSEGLQKEVRGVWAKGEWLRTYCREWIETVDYATSIQLHRRHWLGELPVSVVLPDGYEEGLLRIQKGVMLYSSATKVFTSTGSDHFVQLHRPEIVMDAIADVVSRSKARGIPLCDEHRHESMR